MNIIKEKFNQMLTNNAVLNDAYRYLDKAKEAQKGNLIKLLVVLIIGSFSTMFLSFAASVVGYGNEQRYLISVLSTNMIGVLINNFIFLMFLKCVRKEPMNKDTLAMFAKQIIPQLICASMYMVCQTFILNMVLNITASIPSLNVMLSILIALIFTLLNALTSWIIFDGSNNISKIFHRAFHLFVNNFRPILLVSMTFIAVSYIFQVAFAQLLFSHLQQSQGINDIIHSLLQQRDYQNLLNVNIFRLVNFTVIGFLQIKILLSIAWIYDSIVITKRQKRKQRA